jgi:hypothetical protein
LIGLKEGDSVASMARIAEADLRVVGATSMDEDEAPQEN